MRATSQLLWTCGLQNVIHFLLQGRSLGQISLPQFLLNINAFSITDALRKVNQCYLTICLTKILPISKRVNWSRNCRDFFFSWTSLPWRNCRTVYPWTLYRIFQKTLQRMSTTMEELTDNIDGFAVWDNAKRILEKSSPFEEGRSHPYPWPAHLLEFSKPGTLWIIHLIINPILPKCKHGN